MVFTKFAPLLAVAAIASTAAAAPLVHPGVHRALHEQNTVNLIVTMKGGVDNTLNGVKEAEFATRGQQIASLVADLEANAKTSQQAIDALLSQEAASTTTLFTSQESFWISNQKAIKGATLELVEKLAAIPDIAEIREELVLPPPRFQVDAAANTTAIGVLANEWGVTKIQAPSVWGAGYNGQNIVIGSIDTGVLATHTSISSALRSSYNWYDPTAKKTTPYDDNGHGTHTIGTMVGANGLGVAPGAKFISCRACTNDGCSEAALLSCAQFITCPTTPSGTGKDCTKAPQVVSNSWGGGQGDTFYASAIKTWRSAGIIPVFANGNEGPACKTASSPGDDANVIAVGATDSTDGLASFSSKGPAVNGLVKPEISGPGYQVRSAWNTGNSAFNTISGTSMATPHVSGVVALLLSKKPTLTFAQIKTAITTTADRTTLKATGYTCGNTKDTVFPNNQYGYGRINALKAFQSV